MGLSASDLARLDALLLDASPGAEALGAVRAELPHLRVSRCDASDMRGETPYRRSGAYDVFLVDNRSHCWQLVDDPESAGAVVIARRP